MSLFGKRVAPAVLRSIAGSLLLAAPALGAAVDVMLDRNRITEGETVTLVVTTDDPKVSLEAGLAALEEDFDVLDRRSETQLSIVNGRQTAEVRLLLTLEPRRTGTLRIPSMQIGGESTPALTLRVEPAPDPEPGEPRAVFVEVEVVPSAGPYYVHAQFGVTVRVFYRQNLTEAAISQPEPSPASVRLLQETPYQADRNGARYRVLERRYAVFPERSGELVIPPLELTGRLMERRAGSIWEPTARGRRINVKSDPLRLTIEPRPEGYRGPHWQPARELQLTQQISAADALRVGEPVTRTVIIDAVGLEENMIAEPVWPELDQARIYPDRPQGITRDDGTWVLGHKEFRYAVVPEAEGALVLPELTVHWWDTVEQRERTAVLPSKTLEVLASNLVPPQPGSTGASARSVPVTPGVVSPGADQPVYWRWLTLVFAALWLATLAYAWRRRDSSGSPHSEQEKAATASEQKLLRELREACRSDDPAQARRMLIQWLREFGPSQADGSLLNFASGDADETLREELLALDATGFRADGRSTWDGKRFWRLFADWRQRRRTARDQRSPPLSDLYAPANRTR